MLRISKLILLAIAIVSATGFTQFQQESLDSHNKYRALHCAPPLVLDDQLNQIAQQYAEYLASTNAFEHSNNGYGENLYMTSSSVPLKNVPGSAAVKSWYDEINDYDFDYPGFSMETGHFTQVVWKGSQHLGVGIAFGNGGRTAVIVANYDGPGNYQGQFDDHVSPPECSETVVTDKVPEQETGTVPATGFTQFQQESLDSHNKYRALHCAPPLVLDDQLNQIAQQYAEYLASTNAFEHSNNGYGENLYMTSSSVPLKNVPGSTAVKSWYDEINDYDFDYPGFTSGTGHFTQVVWKGSQRLGVGIAFGNGGTSAYVVANYDPPGNYQEQFQAGVLPPNC